MKNPIRLTAIALVASLGLVPAAKGGALTLNACRPLGSGQDFSGRILEVTADAEGMTCGVVPHVLPVSIQVDARNDVYLPFRGSLHYFGRAQLLGHYQVPRNYRGSVLNECRLYEIFPDADVQVRQSERAGIPYPSVHLDGMLLLPLPVLKRGLNATLEFRLNGHSWASSSCVQDQIRLPRGEWEAVPTEGDSESPACERFLQVLPDDHAHVTRSFDSQGKVVSCAHGILQAK
jgi:hypothetical protein